MRLTVNGSSHDVDAAPDTALLYVLRNDLELNGPKYGCGLGECGACIAEQAAQCGYCLNGMIITTKALLMRNPHPTEHEVLEALRYNLCRCGAHVEIIRAAMRAAGHVLEAHD